MELKDFITETIKQVTEGIRESQRFIEDNKYGDGISDDKGKEINFDVAVTSETENTKGVGGKISVASILNVSGEDQNTLKNSNLSRIQFKLYLHINAK